MNKKNEYGDKSSSYFLYIMLSLYNIKIYSFNKFTSIFILYKKSNFLTKDQNQNNFSKINAKIYVFICIKGNIINMNLLHKKITLLLLFFFFNIN